MVQKRALQYVDYGDLDQAWASICSDLGKHHDTVGHLAIELGSRAYFMGFLSEPFQMRNFIEGIN